LVLDIELAFDPNRLCEFYIRLIRTEDFAGAALHGLRHLHHPSTHELVQSYIRQHPSLGEEWKKYALAVARFEIM